MPIEVPDQLPTSFEELDDLLARTHTSGVEQGRNRMRDDVKAFLNAEILAAKGNERRPDPEDPKVQAIRSITERLYRWFEEEAQ